MLPNWLYGKSKSKLVSILGGGGSTPPDYDQVKAQVAENAEDIATNTADILLLSDALDGKAALTQISNPNILHNPWFNVNQRGVTSVTASNEFIADRWRVYTTLATFEVTRNSSGYIVIDNTSGDAIITVFQKRTSTYINSLHGKKVTASVMFSDGTIKSGSITFDSTQSGTYYSDDDYALNYNPTSGSILAIVVRAGKTATVKALKLEVGEVSTLAMDPRPEYATELAKCQRYFQTISQPNGVSIISLGVCRSTTEVDFVIKLNSEMRAAPTLAQSGLVLLSPDAQQKTISSVTLTKITKSIAVLRLVTSGVTLGATMILALDTAGYLDFSAEL